MFYSSELQRGLLAEVPYHLLSSRLEDGRKLMLACCVEVLRLLGSADTEASRFDTFDTFDTCRLPSEITTTCGSSLASDPEYGPEAG